MTRSSAARRLRRAAVAATAMIAAWLLGVLAAPSATAQPGDPGMWGPDGVQYLSGVVCSTATGSAALVSWPSPVDGGPAYALDPVLGPASSSAEGGEYVEPAVDATGITPLTAGSGGLSAQQVAGLAYLLEQHGTSELPGVVADVAAAVASVRADSPVIDACGRNGAALWNEAQRLAGPYSVRVLSSAGKLTMGQPDTLTAQVTAASGAPVPGLSVSFTASTTGAALATTSAQTDGAGQARTTLTVPTHSTLRAVQVRATVQAPGGVTAMSAPGAATLVSAAAPRPVSGVIQVPVDTTADPVVSTTLSQTLALPGTTVTAGIAVTGLRGHDGTGTVAVRGPLPFRRAQACGGYAAKDWDRLDQTPGTADGVPVLADRDYRAATVRPTQPGCYLVSARVATTNAVPNVQRQSTPTVLTVAPLTVATSSDGRGVSLPGRLHAHVTVHGPVPAHLTGLSGQLLGPLPSSDGSCSGMNWTKASAQPVTFTAADQGASAISAPVHGVGCYAFRSAGTLVVPGAGSLSVSAGDPSTATVLVLDPSASVVGLSNSWAPTGGELNASVTVSGSYTQAGALQLQMLHLPYDWRGCYGRDWSHAQVVKSVAAPAQSTVGDGTYSVPSPKVPSGGCWTVLPVLTLKANPAVRVTDTAVANSTLAFTSIDPTTSAAPRDVAQVSNSGNARLIVAAVGMLALLVAAFVATLSIAVHSAED